MENLSYLRASSVPTAITALPAQGGAYLAGGTNLLDLMKLEVVKPTALVDINHLRLAQINVVGEHLEVGALVRNSDLAQHPLVAARLPMLAQAIMAGASPQLRNMATLGGNILQRTRCPYFNDIAFPCNKRQPGSGCPAINGYNRSHAVLGASTSCIATHPSDMCVALAALGATLQLQGPQGARTVAFTDFHREPATTPQVESVLAPGEMIVGVTIPLTPVGARSVYVKVRDRASYAFALAAAAAGFTTQYGKITAAAIAVGGVATKPWRLPQVEQQLIGQAPDPAAFSAAAALAVSGAQGHRFNAFKIDLVQRVIVQALLDVKGLPT